MKRKKLRLVEVSQLFLSGSVVTEGLKRDHVRFPTIGLAMEVNSEDRISFNCILLFFN